MPLKPYVDPRVLPTEDCRLLLTLLEKPIIGSNKEALAVSRLAEQTWKKRREHLVAKGLINVRRHRCFRDFGRINRPYSFFEFSLTDKGKLVAKELAVIAELIR